MHVYTACAGDAAGRSGGPTGGSPVGGLSVCSPVFPGDGQQPAVIRCVFVFPHFHFNDISFFT